MKLKQIYIYPVKSLGGYEVQEARLLRRGLEHDRRWMLVNPKGRFLTQRQIPEMALLQVNPVGHGWEIRHKQKDIPPLFFPHEPEDGGLMKVKIWSDSLNARIVSDQANQWLSNTLGKECLLVHMGEQDHRPLKEKYAKNDEIVGFVDRFPFLIIGTASMDLLNSKLSSPVLADRFRPSFIFESKEAHEEDRWESFSYWGSFLCRCKTLCQMYHSLYRSAKWPNK